MDLGEFWTWRREEQVLAVVAGLGVLVSLATLALSPFGYPWLRTVSDAATAVVWGTFAVALVTIYAGGSDRWARVGAAGFGLAALSKVALLTVDSTPLALLNILGLLVGIGAFLAHVSDPDSKR